jgi:hypothetical protein
MDSGCAPQWIFPAHPLDQITQAPIDLRPPCPISRFPTPERFKASAMPPQNGLRLNHLGHTEQARPEPGQPSEQRAVTAAQSTTRRRPPQCYGELMAEKQILGFKPAARLEQIDEQPSEPVQDCKHRLKSCDDSALRCESRLDGIFGKDRSHWRVRLPSTSPSASLPSSYGRCHKVVP